MLYSARLQVTAIMKHFQKSHISDMHIYRMIISHSRRLNQNIWRIGFSKIIHFFSYCLSERAQFPMLESAPPFRPINDLSRCD